MTKTNRTIVYALAAMMLGACGGGESTTAPPDPSIVATVSVTPGANTLVSLDETVQLVGAARNAAGGPAEGAVLAWTSSAPTVVSVSGSGLVTAIQTGTATISATAGGKSGTAAVTVTPRVASIEMTEGHGQGAMVGTTLDTVLTFVVRDALGSAVDGAVIDFTPAAGSGAVEPAQVTAGADGIITTAWTLGTVPGVQELYAAPAGATVRDTVSAVAFVGHPNTITLESGDSQSELAALPLPAPIAVRVVDTYGNAIPDLPILFAASGGTLDSTEVVTDLEGIARTTWTLGATPGAQTASASIPDSVIAEGVVVSGGPVAFTATAVEFTLGAFAGTPVSGSAATISGTGFAPVAGEHTVSVGGVAAEITAGTQSSLTFTMPDFGCEPGAQRIVSVTRNGATQSMQSQVDPAGLVTLAPGEYLVRSEPGDGCIQLPSGDGGDQYLVGLTATRQLSAGLPFELSGSLGPPPMMFVQSGAAVSGSSASMMSGSSALLVSGDGSDAISGGVVTGAGRHQAHRAWQKRFLTTRRRVARTEASLRLAPRQAAAVGDLVDVRIPNITTDACNDFTPVSARVLAEGLRARVVTDAAFTPTAGEQITLNAALLASMTHFSDVTYDELEDWFGAAPDVDADGRIVIVLSSAVTAMDVPAFSSGVDELDVAVCPASNEAEVVYVGLPLFATTADVIARVGSMAPDLAHELAHVMQASRIVQGGVPQATWLEEGQAELGVEVVGFRTIGDAPRTNLLEGSLSGPAGNAWYGRRFDNLSSFFGWDGALSKLDGAPQQCSLFGFGGASVPCTAAHASGASWSFMRYVVDRFAESHVGGATAFMRQFVTTDIARDGTAQLAALTGSTLEELMVEWAMMLWVDDRVPAAQAPLLQFPSWSLPSVYDAKPVAEQLVPQAMAFAPFAIDGIVIGGGTAYTTVSAAAAHPAIALSMRGAGGAALGTEMAPRIWVVRVR